MIPTDWWRTFFSGLPVDFWLKVPTEEQTRTEVDFLEKTLRLLPGAKVLDVPCGGGRHALEMVARGYAMTGVDLSTDFLNTARKQAADRLLPLALVQREMNDLPWQGEFDGAYCFGNSFGYQDDAGNAAFLKAVARSLKPKARFVLDTSATTETLFPAFQERRWLQAGDILFLSQGRYDPVRARVDTEYTFVRDGHSETRLATTRIYSYRELCQLFVEAGFTDCTGFGSLQQEAFRLGSPRLLLVGTRS